MQLDTYDSPEAQALLRIGKERRTRPLDRSRELRTQAIAAAAFLTAAALLAAIAPWHRPLDSSDAVLAVATYIAVERVRFPVANSWTYPTMLAFVPMLFMLPTPVVPLAAMTAILLGAAPGYLRGRTTPTRLPADIADAWYSMGPALVIVLAGAQHFGWSHWPVYVGALLAQYLFDFVFTVGRTIVEGVNARVQIPLMMWTYACDTALASFGLLIAASAVARPGLVLLTLPVVGLLYLFARERQQRLDATLELSTAYRGTTLLLGDIIEADDGYTGMHSRDVVDLSLGVADALGLDATERRNVEFGALLHDVGKIRIPKDILNKSGPLNALEWEFVRRHTTDGEQMLRQVGGKLAEIASIVRASHERWDGGGYPDGLAGEEIPIEARIISACDAFNAMTTDRPYRSAMHRSEALDELRHGSGGQFDPRVVEALDRRIGAELMTERARSGATPEDARGPENAPRKPQHPGYTALSARL